MANIIKIKRSTTTSTPPSLAEGELAYSEKSHNLFVGISGGDVAKVGGYTDVNKLETVETGAEVNVNSDWLATEGDAYIKNKPDYILANHPSYGVTSDRIVNWDASYDWFTTMTNNDGDSIINTVSDIVNAFENHSEGLNLITELDNKLTPASTIDGGTY